jgi:hypothetical protein
VQHGTHLIRRQVNIRLAVIAQYKPVSIAVTLDGAFDLVQQAAGMAGRFDKYSLFTDWCA